MLNSTYMWSCDLHLCWVSTYMLSCGSAHLVFYRILTYMLRYILRALYCRFMTKYVIALQPEIRQHPDWRWCEAQTRTLHFLSIPCPRDLQAGRSSPADYWSELTNFKILVLESSSSNLDNIRTESAKDSLLHADIHRFWGQLLTLA